MDDTPIKSPNGASPQEQPGLEGRQHTGGDIPPEARFVPSNQCILGKYEYLPGARENDSDARHKKSEADVQSPDRSQGSKNDGTCSNTGDVGSPPRPNCDHAADVDDVVELRGADKNHQAANSDQVEPTEDSGIQDSLNPDDDGAPSDNERPIKRQRTDEEDADDKPSTATHDHPMSTEDIAKLEKLRIIREQRELSEFEGWVYEDLLIKSGMGGMKKEESDIKQELLKEEEQKMKAPANEAPKRQTRKAVHNMREFWEREDKEEKASGRKRKLAKVTGHFNIAQLVEEGSSMEARAARGDVQLASTMEATGRMREDIKRMIAPGARRGDAGILYFAIRSFGSGNVKTETGTGKLKVAGISKSLYPYQVVGVSEMGRMECSTSGNKGGLLADEPGMGKSIQIGALIFSNPPTKKQKKKKNGTTLIVCPPSSVGQFRDEVEGLVPKKNPEEEKVPDFDADSDSDDMEWEDEEGVDTIMQYRRSTAKDNGGAEFKSGVLFVTYPELAAAYPSKAKIKEIKAMKLKPEEEEKLIRKASGPLLQHKFHRVILDEGHAIKNYNSTTSKACRLICSEHRWIVTGTPMHNRSEELLSYFEFLRIDPGVGKLKLKPKPNEGEGKGKGKATVQAKRVQAENNRPKKGDEDQDEYYKALTKAMERIMIRRRANDKFLGSEIMQIPQNHPAEILRVDLSHEEMIVYRQLEFRYNETIKEQEALDKEDRNKMSEFVLVAITRLRQAVSHPYALGEIIKAVFGSDDFKSVARKLAEAGNKVPANSPIRKLVETEINNRMGYASEQASSKKSSLDSILKRDPLLKDRNDGEDAEGVVCSVCTELPENPIIIKCGHKFCADCLSGQLETEGLKCPRSDCERNLDDSDPSKDFQHGIDDTVTSISATHTSDEKASKGTKKEAKKRRHGDDDLGFQHDITNTSYRIPWVVEYDNKYPECKIERGAKLHAAFKHIEKWQSDAPDDKIIVFIQSVPTAAILARILCEENIRFVQFWGELSNTQKDKAKAQFFKVPEVKIMIASLRCGGQALNLTCANRVLILDPWWNRAMEVQAFGRVARIGQTKETYLAKIVADSTIEVDMVNLQKVKVEDIGKVLRETAANGREIALKLLGGFIGLKMKTGRKK